MLQKMANQKIILNTKSRSTNIECVGILNTESLKCEAYREDTQRLSGIV